MVVFLCYCYILEPSNIDCNFEKDKCGWTQTDKLNSNANANLLWKRAKGSTSSKTTGPVNDHTGS